MKLFQFFMLSLLVISLAPKSLATSPMMPCSECNELGYSLCTSKFQTTDVYNLPECRSVIDKCYASCRENDPFKCGSLSKYDCGGKYWDCIALKQESDYIGYGEEKKIGNLKIKLVDLQEKTCPPDCAYVTTIQGAFKINGKQSIDMILNGENKVEIDGRLYLLRFNGLYEIANRIIGTIGEPTPTEPSTRLDRKSSLSASVLVYNLGSVSEREKRSQCFDQVISCFNDCPQNIPKACTAEAKLCPDGASVGRNPLKNCEFNPCPSEIKPCQKDARVCPDGTAQVRDPYNNCEFPKCPTEQKCDAGCYLPSSDRCASAGFRSVEENIPSYCDVDNLIKKQKADGSEAQNSYECLSNFQSDGKCVSVSENLNILQKIIKWFSKIFGGN